MDSTISQIILYLMISFCQAKEFTVCEYDGYSINDQGQCQFLDNSTCDPILYQQNKCISKSEEEYMKRIGQIEIGDKSWLPQLADIKADAGPCRAYFPMYYYNNQTGTCEEFIYGGCKGNINRFDTKVKCIQLVHARLLYKIDQRNKILLS